jgi:hypothetical protein
MHAASVIEYEKSYTNLAGFFFDGFKKLLKPALLVLVFILMFGVFLVLIAFEILSAYSCSNLVFNAEYPFYEVESFGSTLLMVLIFI